MATYPSGLHWIILLEKVSEIRSTTRSTISNLLSGNDCFVNIQDKKGYWRLEISKLSGYYTDENNQRTVQKIEPDEEFHTANKVREEEVIEIVKVGNVFPLHVEEDFEEDYELPPLEETFTRWAKKQRSIRYSTADEKAKSKEERIEILTHSYSKLFCQLAKSRRSHSLEYMDLVQESFLGLLKAIDKYNQVNSFAQYARLRIRQHLTRIITDRRLLIRIPAHLMEDLNKLEKLMTSTLVTKGRFPKDDEIQKTDIDYSIKRYLLQLTIDFISFEQYWLYLKGLSGQNKYESKGSLLDPWVSEDLINYPLYELLLDKPLLDIEKELEILCTVDEEDTEIMWIEDNKIIENKLLAEELEKLLEGLSSREENVIRLRFGLNDDKTRTLEEIAKIFGLTRERIRQIEKKAMIKLKNASSKKELELYL
ncbi:sigma-70 family RNA polymerase sigma factor [Bacillus sp. CFBP 13597]|nr:sigma-70 family RNA polymerase sigma factor [Bacillus sp. CFBP 13597]